MRRIWTIAVPLICLVIVLSFALAGCGGDDGPDEALLGVWTDPTGVMELEFKSDGVMVIRAMGEEQQGTYTAEGGKLSAIDPDTGEPSEVEYSIDGDTLTLGADGEEGTLVRKQ